MLIFIKMVTKRLTPNQIVDENGAREFIAGKLVDLVRIIDTKYKKDIDNAVLAYWGTSKFVRDNYSLDTTPYDSLATKLIEGEF